MNSELVGKAAKKVGRNNTNGVTHLTSKTLFDKSHKAGKKKGASRKNLAKFWHRRTCSYGKVEKQKTKKWGGGRANVLTNLSSIQPICGQKLGRRG